MEHDKGIIIVQVPDLTVSLVTDVNYYWAILFVVLYIVGIILAIGILLSLHFCHRRIRMKGETLRRTLRELHRGQKNETGQIFPSQESSLHEVISEQQFVNVTSAVAENEDDEYEYIDDIALDGEQFVFENNQCYKTVNRPRDANQQRNVHDPSYVNVGVTVH